MILTLHRHSYASSVIVVLANDTDVLVLILRYMFKFISTGVKKVFIRIGSRLNTRYKLVDQLAINLGETSCLNIIKSHIATGCDWLSKLGCKSKVLDEMNLLNEFGEGNLTEEILDKAEEYLCSVLKGKEVFKTFDDYRHHQLTKLCTPLVSLLPPSEYIRNGHIKRLLLLIRYLIILLTKNVDLIDPQYGWEIKNGYLLPAKCLRLLPKAVYITARKGVDVRNVTLNAPYIANVKVVISAKTMCILYILSLLFVFIIVLILEIFTYYFTHQ